MPTVPRGKQRPANVTGGAIMAARLSVGDIQETPKESSAKPRSGIAGAKTRAEHYISDQRQEIARKAATARWR